MSNRSVFGVGSSFLCIGICFCPLWLEWKLHNNKTVHDCLKGPAYLRGQVLLSMEPWAVAKKLLVSVTVPPASVRVPSQRVLVPSVASVTSVANDKGDNEMILGAIVAFLIRTIAINM